MDRQQLTNPQEVRLMEKLIKGDMLRTNASEKKKK